MIEQLSLRISSKAPEVATLTDAIESFLARHQVSPSLAQIFSLAFDEIVTNVASYAHNDDEDHLIDISIALDPHEISAAVVDDGMAFDPLQIPEPDTTLSIEEREVGGLGIFLVRKLMDRVAYERRDDRNHLTFAKRR